MIRGTSKKIIEVNNTGSELFEKAIFYIKNDTVKSDKELHNEANRIILSYISENCDGYKVGYLRKKDQLRRKKLYFSLCTVLVAVGLISLMILLF